VEWLEAGSSWREAYSGGPAYWSFGYYNNHPFASDPRLRPRMLEAARARLRAEGIGSLAEASYPESGDEEGYTRRPRTNRCGSWTFSMTPFVKR
jgi:hypothetical protein